MPVIRRLISAAAIVAVAAVPLFAQKPTQNNEQEYRVTFAFNNSQTYSGTMTLAVSETRVSGKMAIDSPETVTGTVAGTLKANTLALDYPFELAGDQPCTGRVTVSATFNASRTEAKGTTHTEGCGDPLDGEFTMTKANPKAGG